MNQATNKYIEIKTIKNQSKSKINDKDKNGKNHRFLFPPLPPNAGDLALIGL